MAAKKVEAGHKITADEKKDKSPAEVILEEQAGLPVEEVVPETIKEEQEEKELEPKLKHPLNIVVLTKAATFLSDGVLYKKGEPVEVEEELKEKLLKTGLFE
ncbi:hypothetical protein [Eubacterium sp.]|uniref:hypothetical protein n=1 Tax=Eubacterium sp. TaxID=142586 RepID=UPI0026DFA23A|nr:hypothetical protein [Eubacterium sp.]MDO5433390.1 hypothetical protein [Eubacterium sp.]